MRDTEEAVAERRHRDERPARRPFRTARVAWYYEALVWLAVTVPTLLLVGPLGMWVFCWVAVSAVVVLLWRSRQSTHPRDPGLQIYDDVDRARPGIAAPAGVSSSQLYVPYGIALGWFVERGLVSDWFRAQSGSELDDLAAGRLTGPELYARWHGVFASDMLDEEGQAFTRRYMWGAEPFGVLQNTQLRASQLAWPTPRRPHHRWFHRDLATLQGDLASPYLLPDDAATADAFAQLADRRLARWRRWRIAFALYEAERASVRRKLDRHFAPPA